MFPLKASSSPSRVRWSLTFKSPQERLVQRVFIVRPSHAWDQGF